MPIVIPIKIRTRAFTYEEMVRFARWCCKLHKRSVKTQDLFMYLRYTHPKYRVTKNIKKSPELEATLLKIRLIVSNYYGVSIEELESPVIARRLCTPRQVIAYLGGLITTEQHMAKVYQQSRITLHFRKKKCVDMMDVDKVFKQQVEDIKKLIYEYDPNYQNFLAFKYPHPIPNSTIIIENDKAYL